MGEREESPEAIAHALVARIFDLLRSVAGINGVQRGVGRGGTRLGSG